MLPKSEVRRLHRGPLLFQGSAWSAAAFPCHCVCGSFTAAEPDPLWGTLNLCCQAATKASFVTFSDRPPPRAVLLPPPPRPPRPPRGPPRPRPGRPRSPKLMSSWDVMSLAGLRKWCSADSSLVWRRKGWANAEFHGNKDFFVITFSTSKTMKPFSKQRSHETHQRNASIDRVDDWSVRAAGTLL